MKSIFFALAAVASLAVAAPSDRRWHHGCISQSDAELLVSRYQAVIAASNSDLGDPVTTAQTIAADGYTEQSDSANILVGLPLGVLTVDGKAAWIQESQSNPPLATTTQEIFTACHKVVWEWVSTSTGTGEYPVQGIHVFTVDSNGQITAVHFEFNSLAAALDTGYTVYYPNGTQFP